jgi:anti-sigma B factor antagonist
MEMNKTVDGSKATIELTGKLTVQTAPELEEAIGQLAPTVADVAVDLTAVEYISSAGLRVLVGAEKLARSRGGQLRLLHPQDAVMEVFDMTGLSTVLAIER